MITKEEFIAIGKKYGMNVQESTNLIYFPYNEDDDYIMCSYNKTTNIIDLYYDFKYNPYIGQNQYDSKDVDTNIKFEKLLRKTLKEYKAAQTYYKMKNIEKDFV